MLKKINLLVISCLFNLAIQASASISIDEVFNAITMPHGYEIVESYIESNPDKIDSILNGYTLLQECAWHNKPRILALLINHGANPNTNILCARSLHHAIEYKRIEIAKLLIDAGIDLEITNILNKTALEIARKHHLKDVVALIEKKLAQKK